MKSFQFLHLISSANSSTVTCVFLFCRVNVLILDIYSSFIVHKRGTLLIFHRGGTSVGMLKRLRRFFKCSKFYHCPQCGYELPKEEAVSLGWDSQQSLYHIHYPNMQKKMTHVPWLTIFVYSWPMVNSSPMSSSYIFN